MSPVMQFDRPASAGSPPRKLSKGETTRRNILESAEISFAEVGFDAARLDMIAEDVGIKQAAIFYHFPSKRKLFDELNQEIQASLIRATEARLHGATDPWERLMLLVEAWLDFMVARPTAARLILRGCADATGAQGEPGSYSTDALQLLRAVIGEGVTSGRFGDVSSMYLVNLLSGSILHYVCNPGQLGSERPYQPDDPAEVAMFKAVLRKTARAILDVQ